MAALTREHADAQPETPAEAVDALIEAGQEEGIIQEGDRELFQSVVEFSGKTVREAMKPRPEMVAVAADSTVEQVVELLRVKPFSRIPVYEGSITTSREFCTRRMCCRCRTPRRIRGRWRA